MIQRKAFEFGKLHTYVFEVTQEDENKPVVEFQDEPIDLNTVKTLVNWLREEVMLDMPIGCQCRPKGLSGASSGCPGAKQPPLVTASEVFGPSIDLGKNPPKMDERSANQSTPLKQVTNVPSLSYNSGEDGAMVMMDLDKK